MAMYSQLLSYINSLEAGLPDISPARKQTLDRIAGYIRDSLIAHTGARLTFICTHNSRRSQLCQIWAATLAEHFDLGYISTFSGGTEATAFNPRAVKAIKRAGFRVDNPGGANPRYNIYFDEDREPLICFSKVIDDEANPHENFAAVMTCSDAERNCPVVPGADARFSLPYDDPKQADGTPAEVETYNSRCRQIATEMYYLLSQLN